MYKKTPRKFEVLFLSNPHVRLAGRNEVELSAGSGTRTRTELLPQDFKSCVSTSSTIPALQMNMLKYTISEKKIQDGNKIEQLN